MTKRKKAKTKGKPKKAAAAKVIAEVAADEAEAALASQDAGHADDAEAAEAEAAGGDDLSNEGDVATNGDLEDPVLASLDLSVAMEAAASDAASVPGEEAFFGEPLDEGATDDEATGAPADDDANDATDHEATGTSADDTTNDDTTNDAPAPPPSASASDNGLPSDLDVVLGDDSRRDATGEHEDDDGTTDAVEVERNHLRGLVEALVFASDSPMPSRDIARHASAPVKRVREILDELRREYQSRGIHLDEVAGGWTFRTSVQYAPFVRDLTKQKPVKLTRAQVEALAIIAYRQPITRPEIDEVRGVDSGPVLKVLLERDLVRILGKRDEPGRPLIYGTTPKFLEFFGLRSLKDLPTLREFTELTDESRQAYEDELGESPTEHLDEREAIDDGGEAGQGDEGEGRGGEGSAGPAFAIDEDDVPHAHANGARTDRASDEPAAIADDVPSNIAGELADLIGESEPDSERGEEIEEPIDPGEDVDEAALEELADEGDFGESDLEELGRQALEELELDPSEHLAPEPPASSASSFDVSDDDPS